MLYTRKGDAGTTKTFGCNQRMSKSSKVAEALGALDEVNSFVGLVRADISTRGTLSVPVGKVRTQKAVQVLFDVQQTLFVIQAEVAGAEKIVKKSKIIGIERTIDSIEQELPPINSFLVAGSSYASALFDVLRTIVRRAERSVVAMHEEGIQTVRPHTLAYLNRLSSLFYALARYASYTDAVKEEAPTYV